MLFDHDSADSLRNRAEVINRAAASDKEVAQQHEGHPGDALPPGTVPSNHEAKHHTKIEPPVVHHNVVIPPGRSFGLTVEEIARFENDCENLAKYGGVRGVADILKVDPKKGIDGSLEDLVARARDFGENTYPVSKVKPFWKYIYEALQDPTLIILIGCATVSLTVGLTTEDPKAGWYDGGGVGFAIILVLLVSSTSNYRQSMQFRALTAENQKIMINVTRGGKRIKIIIFELVVGDIVHLGIGDQIPGDGLLVKGTTLIIDESSMTGESEPAVKDATHPFLISGCKVIDGTGSQLITAVGMNTEWGKVMATLAVDNEEETPLQVRLNHLAETIGKIGMTVAVSVFIVLVVRLLIEADLKHFSAAEGRKIVNFFAVAVTIIVVAVPEGLPLAVTLTLAYSMHKMMDDRALVRNLSACETMGSATTICSDKTGTLTMNLMTVVSSWVCGKLRISTEMDKEIKKMVEEKLFASICLNTNGHVGISEEGVLEVSGSPTEVACLNWATKLGAVFDDIQKENTIICVDTFNSTKKRMGVVIEEKNGSIWVHWKGASEVLLKQCTRYIDAEGNIHDLKKEKMEELEGIIVTFANSALRTLCFACKELAEHESQVLKVKKPQPEIPDQNLICLAIVGIKDPLRPGVTDAVHKCQVAGIMVMARSSPTDKHTLVKRLLEMGDVVAVTGDGTNDAPALHEASIGLAMGIAGTEVAKESADIIILDDNFASIVKVVRWGRSVYVNIQKFIQFQCTVNMVALGLNFIAAMANGEAPLTAVQLLWVNLIMDTMGALALATEPPNESLMHRNPVGKREPLITNVMWRNLLGQFAYQLILLLVLQFRGKQLLGLHDDGSHTGHAYKEVETVIFNSFVFCQVFNELNARKPEEINIFQGLMTSRVFLYVIALTVAIQVLLVELCGSFTSTVHLPWHRWLLCVAFGAMSMPLGAIIKFIPVPKQPIWSSWQHRGDLVFREGGSVMSLMLRQGSQKVDLQKSRSVKSTKFYTEFSTDGENAPEPESFCLNLKKTFCPRGVTPSASNDVENPNMRNNNQAWR
ncbi:hypothetical protein GOP47_0018820 [Adiantum capillus-veneris]|uniref:Calcium-transporting ATPase n=1 Tax=Adiantum capillus-veneris TaxID=13818 RepID=A0A9D4UFC1_ADICA|nr:hypothetical protein GOP47_0018820 [Adiantum capillus-veneris]